MKLNYSSAIALALTTAVISGTANFLNKLAVTAVANPTIFTFVKNSLVSLFLIGIIIALKKWPELKQINKKDWYKLIIIGIVGGSVPFILFFKGLSLTSAVNAGLIHKTLFIWVALLAVPILKEKISWVQGAALALLTAGNFVLGGWQNFTFSSGELMIFIATLLWAVETIIAKKTLQNVSSLITASSRMVFGSIILFGVVIWQYDLPVFGNLTPTQWSWTILPSLLLLGYVLTWYTALKHAPAILVASLLVPATLVTNLLSAIFITHSLTLKEMLSAGLFVISIYLFVISIKKTKDQGLEKVMAGSFPYDA
ncbi:MAG: DMT family transporter [Patescibacteria group bacterium]